MIEQQCYIVCPKCGRVSHNPNDVRERYCGACHAFHDDLLRDSSELLLKASGGRKAGVHRVANLTDDQVQSYLHEQNPMVFSTTPDGKEVIIRMSWIDCHLLLELLGAGLGSYQAIGEQSPVYQQFEKRLTEAVG